MPMGSVGGGGAPQAVPVHHLGWPDASGYQPGGGSGRGGSGGPGRGGGVADGSLTTSTVPGPSLALNLTDQSRWQEWQTSSWWGPGSVGSAARSASPAPGTGSSSSSATTRRSRPTPA